MKIGILSDTHDNIHIIEKAVKVFNENKVDLVLHAGDFISPFVPKWFAALKCKLIGVYGNNENERELLAKRMAEVGHEIRGYFALIKADGLTIGLLHGHEEDLLKLLIDKMPVDIIVYGHTHKAEIKEVNGKMIINPGEACGYLTGKSTIVILDTEKREAKMLELR